MLRILVVADVSPVAVLGGGERALWETASRLAARGHAVRIVCRAPRPDAPERLLHHGIPVRHFPVDRRTLAGFVKSSLLEARRAVEDEVAAYGADVLHLHQPLAALGALGSSAGRRLPSLYTFHSPAPLEYRLRRGTGVLHRWGLAGQAGAALLWLVERASLARASRIHVLSDFSAGLLRRLYRVPDGRIVKIPGGVDLDRFRPAADRGAVRRRLGLPEDRPLFVSLRNLELRMGLDRLVHAVDRVRRRYPDVLLVLGGDGPLREALAALVRSLGLQDHIRLAGFVPEADLPGFYAAADAFVLPTRALEGFGLVTVEALACGTPVLGTPVGATPEILTPLDPALVFRDASAGAIAEGLERFLERVHASPEASRRLREASRRHAEARYGWERAVEALESVLAALVGRGVRGEGLCAACGGALGPARSLHRRRFRTCARCGTAAAADPAPDLRRHYERDYPARFPPARVTHSREALFASVVARLGTQAPGRRLLDVGCGGGGLLAAAAGLGWCPLGTDISLEACAVAHKASGAGVVQAEAAKLPFRDGSVDAAAMVNVLDHLPDPAGVLAEVHRVLGAGGLLAVRVLNGAFHRPAARALDLAGPLGRRSGLDRFAVLHLFSFTAPGLRSLVEAAGFDVLEVRNSPPLAARGDQRGPRPPGWLAAMVAGAAALVARGSGGRWLLAPSIELYARRAARPRGGRA